MLTWLKKLMGDIPLANPAGLPDELIQLLRMDLSFKGKQFRGIGPKLLRYVVDGANEEILLTLRATKGAAIAMMPKNVYVGTAPTKLGRKAERRYFFARIGEIDTGVLYRLAMVFEAAYTGGGHRVSEWPHMPSEQTWIKPFLLEGIRQGAHYLKYFESATGDSGPWTAFMLGEVLEHGGHDASALVDIILRSESPYGYNYFPQNEFESIVGLGPYFTAHAEQVAEVLQHPKAAHRAHVLRLLRRHRTTLTGSLTSAVLAQATANAKAPRDVAAGLLVNQKGETKTAVVESVRAILKSGTAPERANAVPLLTRLEGADCHTFLEECKASETGKKVIAAIDFQLQVGAVETDSEAQGAYDDGLSVPEPKSYAEVYDLPNDAAADLRAAFERYNQRAIEAHAQHWDRLDKRWRRGKRIIDPPISDRVARQIVEGLQNTELVRKRKQPGGGTVFPHFLAEELVEFLTCHHLDLVSLIRLGYLVDFISSDARKLGRFRQYGVSTHWHEWFQAGEARQASKVTLLDLDAAFCAAGLGTAWVESFYLRAYHGDAFNPLGLADEAIWPFFQKHQYGLLCAMGLAGNPEDSEAYYRNRLRRRGYEILATFPRPPRKFAPMLWEQALSGSRSEGPLAQACLGGYPGREELIINALEDGKKDVRASAALWLKTLGISEAVTPLKKALKKEKHDEAKAAMMEALEGLGVDVDKFLNRKKLLEESERGIKKGIPAALTWFPFDTLPEVHWAKNKQPVPPAILQWFVVQSFKLKSPEPGALLRRYCDLMHPRERAALGRYVLDAWLAEDTKPRYDQEEAEQEADKSVTQMKRWIQQSPQHYRDFDLEEYRRGVLNRLLTECLGSAASSKGVLAMAGACCGPDAVPVAERFIRYWYGRRAAQCKALLQMLSWVEHPLAIQLILSIGTRFRTNSIRKAAAALADKIAERNGWSREEMADRTIPTAGFDRDGVQVIDYGMRQFTATLLEDFSIRLTNAAGKTIKALPAANKAEDEEEVKALKKEFTASKKELKQVLQFQRSHLYEAMCNQRQWRYEDWELYLNSHPIAGRFCQRLIWIATHNGDVKATFRPLPDRTLTDVNDEPVVLEARDCVQIAHRSALGSEAAAAWNTHLKDYEVEPLFSGFDREPYVLDRDTAKKTELTDFEGHVLTAFKLRSAMEKLGYVRGDTLDGGWFQDYHKIYSSMQVQAVIEFSGNVLPEENRNVALIKLYFVPYLSSDDREFTYERHPLRLSKINGVLLSESWNDMKQIAEEGSGFDPEWEKTCAW